ncbi:unnamed protein product [Mytilus edulis]|uniref:Endonuclease/exonuclease/phosphatase domain-containing protein n=1 Tax=Mytilus edulis TaxID=6550 RepID=A0A8S3QPK4_MYTED|nr:unnamed protein product [Mytilus edulis]
MSFAETTKILAESRKVIEDGNENNTATLLTLILSVVTSVEHSIKKIESGMESIEKIKTTVTLLSADLRTHTKNLKDLEEKSNSLETSVQAMSDMYDQCKTEYKTSSNQISALNKKVQDDEIIELKDKILDLQCRKNIRPPVKNNLIFTGLCHSKFENCENKLRGFLRQELEVNHFIEFGNVHRFGKPGLNGARPIVARFIYHSDLQFVLNNANKLRGAPFGISEQFPAEIVKRRKKLYPVMKDAKQQQRDVVLVRDRLYIDGQLYNLQEDDDFERHMESDSAVNQAPPSPLRSPPNNRITPDKRPTKRRRQNDLKIEKKIAKVKSGGILLGYKQKYEHFIEVIDTGSKFVFWFKISSKIMNTDTDTVFGIVYIPPEYTSYASWDAFSQIENEFLDLSSRYKFVSLVGDFNGRTASEKDFLTLDSHDPSNNFSDLIENSVSILDFLDIPRERKK